ncbi:MAG: ABC transporter permease, partial [Methylothermaceae bacterium]|nr:ABC transporter permease [Methylothermaceae bacterium]
MDTLDIAAPQMTLLYALVLVPWLLLGLIGLRMSGEIAISLLRMSLQLALVGVYLKALFAFNHPLLNGLWLLVMLVAADLTILRRSGLRIRRFFLAT